MDKLKLLAATEAVKAFTELHNLKSKALAGCEKSVDGLIFDADTDPDGVFLSAVKDRLEYELERVSLVVEDCAIVEPFIDVQLGIFVSRDEWDAARIGRYNLYINFDGEVFDDYFVLNANYQQGFEE